MQLTGVLKDYPWGMIGSSLVERLGHQVSPSKHYAELWFGAHPSGASEVVGQSRNLRDIIQDDPRSILGERVFDKFGAELPFLFKILSVGSPLSIQAHPEGNVAKRLNQRDPTHYPDRYPKPEMGIAASDVELLIGFKSLQEILNHFDPAHAQFAPELCEVVGGSVTKEMLIFPNEPSVTIKKLYQTVMTTERDHLKHHHQKLVARLKERGELSSLERRILEAYTKFPNGDPGIFNFYLLNYVTVPEGKAIFIPPNTPHAYLHNELLECMAPSDNVVRAGLTEKFTDIPTLLEILDYRPFTPKFIEAEEQKLAGCQRYRTPDNGYFNLDRLVGDVTIETDAKVELIFCLSGAVELRADREVITLRPGDAILVPATTASYHVAANDSKLFRVSVP